jgi:procollagen-lysine,2-oxoglutarate 5-dioxygenase, invertebrate
LLVTVATEDTISLRAFRRSASIRHMSLEVLGFNQSWKGVGHKVWYQKQLLEKYKASLEKIILFSDANDALINGDVDDIVEKFKRTNHRILFSAEHHCYPNLLLCPK